MMKHLDKIKDVICDEMDETAAKVIQAGKMSAGDLDMLHKMSDTYKNFAKIEMIDGAGYSEDGYPMYSGGDSYARRRDSRGRYTSYDGGRNRSYDGYADGNNGARRHYVRGHYSYDDSKDMVMRELGEAIEYADDPHDKEIIRKAMRDIDK